MIAPATCTHVSSPTFTTQQHGSNLSLKSPSGQLCMIERSQTKNASASNEAGKASNHTRHAQPRHTFLPITSLSLQLRFGKRRASLSRKVRLYVSCGSYRDRTDDLLGVNELLYQLS